MFSRRKARLIQVSQFVRGLGLVCVHVYMELGMRVIWVDIHKSIGGSPLGLIKGRIIVTGDASGQLVFANQSTPRGPLFI